jgi:hypothetical protein
MIRVKNDETFNGHPEQAANIGSDIAFLRAKTEVDVNHEEHRYRMEPRNINKVRSIVNYHWSPKKRREMQNRVNRITEPIENQTLEEVWETIKQRKEAKLDVTDILSGLNITRSYQEVERPRATVTKTSVSPSKKTTTVTHQIKVQKSPSPTKHETNDWSFVEDNEILIQELGLGKDLLSKAIIKITPELLSEIASSQSLSDDDKKLVSIMTAFVHYAADPQHNDNFNWEDSRKTILENSYLVLHELKNFSDNVINRRIHGNQVSALKDTFISCSCNENPMIIDPIREFLCEAFCLIDILDEIQLNQSPDKRSFLKNLSAEKHKQ